MLALGLVGGFAAFLYGLMSSSWLLMVIGLFIAAGCWAGEWRR